MTKKPKKYSEPVFESMTFQEPLVLYNATRPGDIFFKKVFDLIGMIYPKATQSTEYELIPIIRKGLSKKQLDHLMTTTGLSLPEMARILHVSERTLHRYSADTMLNPDISERIFELARLYAKGVEVFSDLNRFKIWMQFPSIALAQKAPLDFLDTSIGIKLLEEELGRIEHGVYA